MSRDLRSIGDVRPSQVITTYGPGAIVDLQTISVIVAGIDDWPIEDAIPISEERLQQALGVKRFYAAIPAEGDESFKLGTVPTYIFPRYQVCPICDTLSEFNGKDTCHVKYNEKERELVCTAPGCKGIGRRAAPTNPAPFVTACLSGHLDDLPWRRYLHRGDDSCRKRMQLYSVGRTGTVADLRVKCACGKDRSVADAFGEKKKEALGDCTRRRPWLGTELYDRGKCEHSDTLVAMQRGATNAWFPLVKSALRVGSSADPVVIAIGQCPSDVIDGIDTLETLQFMLERNMLPNLEGLDPEEVWKTIRQQRGETPPAEADLRWPEWQAFKNPEEASKGNKSELLLKAGEIPNFAAGLIKSFILAHRLTEVRALTSFTRVDNLLGGPDDDRDHVEVAPIRRKKLDWLPAIEVRGEGLFIELEEERLAAWETTGPVTGRSQEMERRFAEWETERGGDPGRFPGARFVLLHTLAHALIRQVSLDCGYPAASVRERIYSTQDPARPMAGVLIYTATPDSEGSLGGLVGLGSKDRFSGLLYGALKTMTRCSSDPLCADHAPDVHATINGAACHACSLVSETSCENFNRFLDRSFLVPTMAHGDMAYFSNVKPR
jgi:hypothetical protein